MFTVQFIIHNTSSWTKEPFGGLQGIHLLQPGQNDIANAIEKCERDLFQTVHVYDNQMTSNNLAAAIDHYFNLKVQILNRKELTVNLG